MKKLIFLVSILLIVGGCSLDYKSIKPKEPITGTIVQIDSAQWTPVLIQVDGNQLIILDKDEIRQIALIDESIYALLFLLIVLVVLIVTLAFTK